MTPERFLEHVLSWFPVIILAVIFLGMTIRIARDMFYHIGDDDQ